MDIFDKLKFDSLAKKKDVNGLLESLITRGAVDSKCEMYILDKLESNFIIAEIEKARNAGVKLKDYKLLKIYQRMGDESTIRKLVSCADAFSTGIVQTVMTLYERNKSEVLRSWIIATARENIQKSIDGIGLIQKNGPIPKRDYPATHDMILLIDMLGGWDVESADMLVKRIDFYEDTIMRILRQMGMPVVEKLIPWLDNKNEGYIHKTWHRGEYDSMSDSYGDSWYSGTGEKHPIQERVRRVLFEITGQQFGTVASARRWLEKQSRE